MYSIGVDIGTSTTEIVISNISISTVLGPSLLPTTKIEDVTVLYQSPVFFTPLLSKDTIDFQKLREIIHSVLHKSGIYKEEIATGAVIITGETSRKDNAALVTKTLSEYLGDFVVATAGPKLESVLAGRGAGMGKESQKRNKRILNLDIGGGTLNAALFDNGLCEQSFALDIGGRLIKINQDFIVTYLSDRIQFLIQEKNFSIELGQKVKVETLNQFCSILADACLQACGLKEMTKGTKRLYITDMLIPDNLDFISVSGGVGEYIQSRSQAECLTKALEYGDIGPILGQKIAEAFSPFQDKLLIPDEKIRATVIGAGCHSLSVSGSTIGYDNSILPLKNIPIIKSSVTPENWVHLYRETKPLITLYQEPIAAVSIKGKKSPGYSELKILAEQIAQLYEKMQSPVIVLLKEDFAKALSQMLRIHTAIKKPIICLDNIELENGDYIDIGSPIGSALPVVIKTLLYQS